MARVPSLSAPQTAPGAGFTQRIDSGVISPDAAAAPFRQMERTGAAIANAGETMNRIQVDAMKQANDLRVADAVNQARQAALDAAYNPDSGYLRLKGNDALSRPEGIPLSDEYGGKYDSRLSEIESGLGNDAQKRAFQLQAAQLSTGFRGDLQKHTFDEYNTYHASVADGTIKLSQQEAALNWSNPDKIDQALNGIQDPETGQFTGGLREAVYNKAKLTGASANMAEAVMNEAASGVHADVIQAALTNNNPTYASGYFDKVKNDMVSSDILKVQGLIDSRMDAHMATGAVNASTAQFSSNFQPSDMDRLTNLVVQHESGGQRYGKDGQLLISAKGAKGEMQVMDATNTMPGFGVAPAKDNSPDERARVGRDYLGAMVKKYGNMQQALAAYNAGPGAVDDAIAQAKKDQQEAQKMIAGGTGSYNISAADAAKMSGNWLDHLPEETKNYVTNISAKFGSGQGRAAEPTKLEFVGAAVAKLGDNPRPETLKLTQEAASKQYELILDARKQQGEGALANAQQELLATGGDMTKLSPAALQGLTQYDPDNYKKASEFAKAVSDPIPTNPEAYATASLHPEEIAAMPEPVFMQYLHTNFSAADQKTITKMRQDTLSGSSDTSINSLNSSALNTSLEGRLESIGINAKPAKGDRAGLARVGEIQRYIREDLYAQQKQRGAKLSPEDIDKRLDTLFTKDVTLKGMVWNGSKKLLGITVDDIPGSELKTIRDSLTARGVTNPAPSAILRIYRNWKLNDGQ